MSRVGGPDAADAPRWTPPMPPVAKTRSRPPCAAIIVAETVVAAQPPHGERGREVRPRGLATDPGRRRRERLELVRGPARRAPGRRGSRPSPGRRRASRTAASDARATSRFCGIRQAVADQRRLEGDDRAAVAERGGDLGCDGEAVGEHRRKRIGAGARRRHGSRCAARRRFATLAAMAPPRPADPGDVIRAQVVLEEHDVAPDGSFAVVVRRTVERNGYVSHLWLVPLGGRAIATPRRLTTGRVRDSRPRISPDGRRVAFRRRLPEDPESPSSLRVLDLDGGRARAVSRAAPRRRARSPGRRTAAASRSPRRSARRGSSSGRSAGGETPAAPDVIRRLDYRWDESRATSTAGRTCSSWPRPGPRARGS